MQDHSVGSRCGADLEGDGVSAGLAGLRLPQDPVDEPGIPMFEIVGESLGEVKFEILILDIEDELS